MKPDLKIAWATLLFLAALALGMAVSATVKADAPSLVERIAATVPRFGAKGHELVDAHEFAVAVDTACNHDRECAARLIAMAIAESGLRLAVANSEYQPHEGDAHTNRDGVRVHLAWGSWQQHANRLNADVWGSDDLLVQARAARSMQLGALAECRKFRGVQPEVAMWRVLSGRGCLLPYSGESMRQELVARVRRAL